MSSGLSSQLFEDGISHTRGHAGDGMEGEIVALAEFVSCGLPSV